jgi:ubiquinone biosynthesis protein UbiJ
MFGKDKSINRLTKVLKQSVQDMIPEVVAALIVQVDKLEDRIEKLEGKKKGK